jgi:hypothetical protein
VKQGHRARLPVGGAARAARAAHLKRSYLRGSSHIGNVIVPS